MSRPVRPPSGSPPPVQAELDGRTIALVPLAREGARRYFERFPADLERYGELARDWCVHDFQHVLNWAIEDLNGYEELDRELDWLAGVLAARGFPLDQLAAGVALLGDVVGHEALAERLRQGAAFVRNAAAPAT